MLINLKWIFKVKVNEYAGVLKNKVQIVAKCYLQEEGIDFEESFAPKALYGLKQVPRAWYDLRSKFLLSQHFSKGAFDLTLFIRKEGEHVILNLRGILISQSKYALEMLKKCGLEQCDVVEIPMVERSKLDEDPNGKAYRKAPYYGKTGLSVPKKNN
uniref:Reverse transcriptase Ty1/copia-type domain-containing protein n=1 Tax=Tanacetum cinerariifolium TaxID=118510 RepID=A0A6L2JYF0_TANCI|nr:hypothetical protein [Tanacetum cinerariifolium]